MQDFIGGLCLVCVLVAFFSIFCYEPPQEQGGGNAHISVTSGQKADQPTDGTAGVVPSVPDPTETKATLETKPSDKRQNQATSDTSEPPKTIDELAWEVIIGKWSAGEERKQLLTAAGYDYDTIQRRVDELLKEE